MSKEALYELMMVGLIVLVFSLTGLIITELLTR